MDGGEAGAQSEAGEEEGEGVDGLIAIPCVLVIPFAVVVVFHLHHLGPEGDSAEGWGRTGRVGRHQQVTEMVQDGVHWVQGLGEHSRWHQLQQRQEGQRQEGWWRRGGQLLEELGRPRQRVACERLRRQHGEAVCDVREVQQLVGQRQELRGESEEGGGQAVEALQGDGRR